MVGEILIGGEIFAALSCFHLILGLGATHRGKSRAETGMQAQVRRCLACASLAAKLNAVSEQTKIAEAALDRADKAEKLALELAERHQAEASDARWGAALKWWSDVEARSADAHTVYQIEAHRRGDVRHADAYAALSEATKDWDRVLVRWVIDALIVQATGQTPARPTLASPVLAAEPVPDQSAKPSAEQRCAKCGLERSIHNVRHPFVSIGEVKP